MSTSIEKELTRITNLENDISMIEKEIDKIKSDENYLDEEDAELQNLTIKNSKLKFRLNILQKAINEEKANTPTPIVDKMISITDHLTQVFAKAIAMAYPDLDRVPTVITPGSSPKFGDYQCNSVMVIFKMLKSRKINETQKDIVDKIMQNIEPSALITKLVGTPAGFINIFLDRRYGMTALSDVLKNGVQPPEFERKRVIVDFSSPNIAKEMHVGHLRSTIIGESICRYLEYHGHEVHRINHVGDWGTQFGMLIAHLKDSFPNYVHVSPPIADLQAFYKASKKHFDEDEAFKKRAYACVVSLQNGDGDSIKAWNLICDVSRKEFQKIYDQLDVKIIERGESFYQSRMQAVIKDLKANDLLVEEEGRTIMWGDRSTNKNSIPLTIIKSDGGFTYDTSDMAAIKHRLIEENANWLIYVTDAGQATHFQTIFECAIRAGILDYKKHRVDHVGFGVVLGEDGKKFKTRSGDTVKLADLLAEGLNRAMDKLKEKGRDTVLTAEELKAAQESVAYGCIKYADLSHNLNNEYVFSFDRMLEDKGNTAVYLLYAYARIKSIARMCNQSIDVQELLKTETISLEHDKEWKLAKVLLKFPDIMIKISKDLCLHYLCEFVYDVCTSFTEFYDSCYCIEKDKSGAIIKINYGRILLAEVTAMILEKCFYILGLKPTSKI